MMCMQTASLKNNFRPKHGDYFSPRGFEQPWHSNPKLETLLETALLQQTALQISEYQTCKRCRFRFNWGGGCENDELGSLSPFEGISKNECDCGNSYLATRRFWRRCLPNMSRRKWPNLLIQTQVRQTLSLFKSVLPCYCIILSGFDAIFRENMSTASLSVGFLFGGFFQHG